MNREKCMIDPRTVAVFVRKDGTDFTPRQVFSVRDDGFYVYIVKEEGSEPYRNHRHNVVVVEASERTPIGDSDRVEVSGSVRWNTTEIVRFDGPDQLWSRIFYMGKDGAPRHWTTPTSTVAIVSDAAASPLGAAVMDYWRQVVASMPDDNDSLRSPYEQLTFIDPESALGQIFTESAIAQRTWTAPPIFPFSCNLSQQVAVGRALRNSISVIDGPPGTGKTQTILNFIANVLTFEPEATIGVVSNNNAAVDNVGEKLAKVGFGFMVGTLGNTDRRKAFFGRQDEHAATLQRFLDEPGATLPTIQELTALSDGLRVLQQADLDRARLQNELEAYRLEQRHFRDFLDRQELPSLASVPLLRRSADTLIDFLATTEVIPDQEGLVARLSRRVRSYVKYGSLRNAALDDTDFLLAVQSAFYDRRIEEIERAVEDTTRNLERGNFDALLNEYQEASLAWFRSGLRDRYAGTPRPNFEEGSFRTREKFRSFARNYPVILSTCHSLRRCIGSGQLLDYLVIDEASQLDLPTAVLALASCRNVVVVGDLLQLAPVRNETAARKAPKAPYDCFDYTTQSALSAIIEYYGDAVPRTMLREHYRCDPAIIGYCNTKFYDGKLVPFTRGEDPRPMEVVRTVPGNFERGRTNIREVEVITGEVIPTLVMTYLPKDIGTVTPYKRQAGAVEKFIEAIEGISDIQTDTVHKYQGREKDVMIMTTVLSENASGGKGMRFIDDPRLVNVAVSRAAKKFVLVTNHDMLPRSRNLRDLIDYIAYHDPDSGIIDSEIASMFDLLYREFSAKLLPLAGRLRGEMKYLSEDIAWTYIHDLLSETRYRDLWVAPQVLLRNEFENLSGLSNEEVAYIKHRSSFDFVVYYRVGNRPAFAVEVDGYAFHRNRPDQERRDALKDSICHQKGLPLLRLPTWHGDAERRLQGWMDAAVEGMPLPADLWRADKPRS